MNDCIILLFTGHSGIQILPFLFALSTLKIPTEFILSNEH